MCRYLASLGMTEGIIDIDIDGYQRMDIEDFDFNYFSNNYSAEIPEPYIDIVKKIFQHVLDEKIIDEYRYDEVNYERLDISLDCQNKELTVGYYYSYYDIGDSSGVQWTDADEGVNEIFEILESDVTPSGDNILTVEYNGSGDSGYIESKFTNGEDVPTDIEDWCYSELESHFGGWEINEGSQGSFHFDINEKEINLNHTYNTEENVLKTIWEEEF